jgi:hypothetical protein
MRSEESDLEKALRRRREVLSAAEKEGRTEEEQSLPVRWKEVLNTYREPSGKRAEASAYPRGERLFEIVRQDGRIKLMLDYDEENPNPDFTNRGQRRQVESLLGFEQPLERLIEEAGNRWQAGDFEGEAALLEQFADSNPQRDSILNLAAEARYDAISGATAPKRPQRRKLA